MNNRKRRFYIVELSKIVFMFFELKLFLHKYRLGGTYFLFVWQNIFLVQTVSNQGLNVHVLQLPAKKAKEEDVERWGGHFTKWRSTT